MTARTTQPQPKSDDGDRLENTPAAALAIEAGEPRMNAQSITKAAATKQSKAAVARAARAKAAAVAAQAPHFATLVAASDAARALHKAAMTADDAALGTDQEDAADAACEEACTASCIADCAAFDTPAPDFAAVVWKLRTHLSLGVHEADAIARPSWNGKQIDENAILAKILADIERLGSPSPTDRAVAEAGKTYLDAREARQSLGDDAAVFGADPATDALLRLEDDALNVLLDAPAQSLAALAAKAKAIRANHQTADGGCSLDSELGDLSERLVGSLTRDLIRVVGATPPPFSGASAGLAAKWIEAREIDGAEIEDEAEAQAAVVRMTKLDREILGLEPVTAADCIAKLLGCKKSLEDGEMGGEAEALDQVIDWLQGSAPDRLGERAEPTQAQPATQDGALGALLAERLRLAAKPIDNQTDAEVEADCETMRGIDNTILGAPLVSVGDAAAKLRMLAVQLREDRVMDAKEGDILDAVAAFISANPPQVPTDAPTPLKNIADLMFTSRRLEETFSQRSGDMGSDQAEAHARALDKRIDHLMAEASFTPAFTVADAIRHAAMISFRAQELMDYTPNEQLNEDNGGAIKRHVYAITNLLGVATGLDPEAVGKFCAELEPCFDLAFRSPAEISARLWLRAVSASGTVSVDDEGKVAYFGAPSDPAALGQDVMDEIARILRQKGGVA